MKKVYSLFVAATLVLSAGGLFYAQENEQIERDADLAPHGKGIGTRYHPGTPGFRFGPNRAAGFARGGSNGISYHNGPIILGTTNVYFIWYGNWSGNSATAVLPILAQNIGGSPYFNINTTYTNSAKQAVTNAVSYKGSALDNYSQGTTLSDTSVQTVVSTAISSGALPMDTNGVYFVLTSQDVNESSGFCTSYCGWHWYGTINGSNIKYSFVGNPARCPSSCAAQTTSSPNNNVGADGMASIISHELEESVTDPNGNAWYDSRGNENADKCAWTFGTTQTASNGSKYNVTLGGSNFLIQQNWVNASGGFCSMSH